MPKKGKITAYYKKVFKRIYKHSILSSFQSVSVEGNKVVSTMTLRATAEILKDGVTCEVFNEHGAESKSFPVDIKKGQCLDWIATAVLLIPPYILSLHVFLTAGF